MEKKLKLYIDDIRIPKDKDWIVVKNYDEFVETIIKHGIESFSTISFDHDLGETAMDEYYRNVQPNYILDYNNITEKTGLDCAKWLILHYMESVGPGEDFSFPFINIHSANPIGSNNIGGYIENFFKNQKQKLRTNREKIPFIIPQI